MQNESPTAPVPRPAATVMLVRREGPGLSIYMTRRSSRSRFMPDAYVFPGGAVDSGDREPALLSRLRGNPGPVSLEFAAAALRELLEEAGVLLACDESGTVLALEPDLLASLRAALSSGASFADLLVQHGLHLDAGALSYYSNWITPLVEPIRFDAHFFLARAPENQIAAADAVEVHDGMWIAPAEALARADRRELSVPFPTRRHLERIAAFDDMEALFEHARGRQVRPMMPVFGSRDERIDFEANDSW